MRPNVEVEVDMFLKNSFAQELKVTNLANKIRDPFVLGVRPGQVKGYLQNENQDWGNQK